MKKYFIYITGLCIIGFTACKKSEIETYDSENYIQFEKSVKDSVKYSFMLFPGVDVAEVPVVVSMSSFASTEGKEYRIEVDSKQTTAQEGTHYSLPGNYKFPSGSIDDTLYVKFYRTAEMAETSYRLVLKVVANQNFNIGQEEYRTHVIWVNDIISEPEWWSKYRSTFLGNYSDSKYRLFIEQTGVADFSALEGNQQYNAARKFKYWLAMKKANGETVYEVNGVEMTVPVKG